MDKVCARPACGAEATARFFFDAAARLVILDARVQEWGGSGVLCEEHADKLTSPRGWVIDDRRVLAPRLFPIGRFENPDRAPARVPAGTAAANTAAANTAAAGAGAADPAVAIAPPATVVPAATVASRARRLATPAAHPSTPLPLDGGPSYALPDDYISRDTRDLGESADAPERLTDTADPGTPLLSRAFDAARSKVRATSTLDALIPH